MRRLLALLLPLATACTMEHQIVAGGHPDDRDDDDDDGLASFGDGGDDWTDAGGDASEDDGDDEEPPEDEDGQDDEPPEDEEEDPGEAQPRAPKKGEIVVNELMIDPAAVSDKTGEWLELRNVGSATLDLSDHLLIDADVDLAELTPLYDDALVVEKGGYLVLCASADPVENGGIDCDATYVYSTWGEGFAMANSGDEVGLVSPEGDMLDAVVYGGEEVHVGASIGVDPALADPDTNDDAWAWCAQTDALDGDDAGTPGYRNNDCD